MVLRDYIALLKHGRIRHMNLETVNTVSVTCNSKFVVFWQMTRLMCHSKIKHVQNQDKNIL